jgi:hypothetical protein
MGMRHLNVGDDGVAALENLAESACLELPSGKRVWVFPDSEVNDAFAALANEDLRTALQQGAVEVAAGRAVDYQREE